MRLYFHVPFCRRRCLYCGFHSTSVGSAGVPDWFVPALKKELAWWSKNPDLLPEHGRTVWSVFFGGGTPSLLSPAEISDLLNAAGRCFDIHKRAEITMEANPESLQSPEQVRELTRAGVNRLSLGVQSMKDEELRLLGRVHSTEQVRQACAAVRAAGDVRLNLDLMWGLPGQTTAGWLETLRLALALEPDHLSCYALTMEEGTPMAEQAGRGLLAFPSEEEAERMYLEGCALLAAHGFQQYEISNFARRAGLSEPHGGSFSAEDWAGSDRWYYCRHNKAYWTGKDYIGIGPSAVSTIGRLRRQQTSSHSLWRALAEKGEMHPEPPEELSLRDHLFETVMLRLRTRSGLPLRLYRRLTGRSFVQDHALLLRDLEREGLVSLSHGRAALTCRGLLVSNDIVARLFERMDELEKQA